MEEFIQKLRGLFQSHFANCEVELDLATPDRVGGFLVWEGFTGREQIDRQREVWRLIRQNLDAGEQRRVSAILTLTPEEMSSARHG